MGAPLPAGEIHGNAAPKLDAEGKPNLSSASCCRAEMSAKRAAYIAFSGVLPSSSQAGFRYLFSMKRLLAVRAIASGLPNARPCMICTSIQGLPVHCRNWSSSTGS